MSMLMTKEHYFDHENKLEELKKEYRKDAAERLAILNDLQDQSYGLCEIMKKMANDLDVLKQRMDYLETETELMPDEPAPRTN